MSEFASFETRTAGDGASREQLLEKLEGQLTEYAWSTSEIFGMQMAVEESLSNAYRHGNKNGELGDVEIRWEITPEAFTIEVKDNGEGFSVNAVPDPVAPENLEDLSGRGLLLMRNYMDVVDFLDGGRRVVMQKTRPTAASR